MHKSPSLHNFPIQEQLDAINAVLKHLISQISEIRDVDSESGTPFIDTIQNLQLRMCRMEQIHRNDLNPLENAISDANTITDAESPARPK